MSAAAVDGAEVRCPCCGHAIPEVDWRPRPRAWGELFDLVEGARQRGFSLEQLEYLRSAIAVAWAKAFKRGEHVARGE